jgi:hypothetical protein
VQQKICEQRSEASAVESDGTVVLDHLEWPEDPELHVTFVARLETGKRPRPVRERLGEVSTLGP